MKLASIEIVASVRPHANADRLELATVLGWQTVIGKGTFKEGDRAVFVVIDTILPVAPWSAFLAHKSAPELPIRLKTAKLRGEFSQGLLLPLSVLPEHMRDWQVGADVGGELGIKKYEKEIPGVLSGEAKGAFPTHFAPRTDEDNGLSNPDIVKMVLASPEVVITQKLDGSSCTVVWEIGVGILDVCSRNLSLRDDGKNSFWRAAKKLSLEWLATCGEPGERIVIQGELMGPGIQGNQLNLMEPELFVFQIRHSGRGYATDEGMRKMAASIGAKCVPLVDKGKNVEELADLQNVADAQRLENGAVAEGIVVRPHPPQTFGNGRPASFKIINRNYGE
jgi:RNA ligase (TIGR02306 family)